MTHRDEIEKSVDEMLAGWFNGERHDVDRNDIIELVMKHSAVDTLSELVEQVPVLTSHEADFCLLVFRSPGAKLNGDGEASHWEDDGSTYGRSVSHWNRPEELGLIACVGGYKWVPTDKLNSLLRSALSAQVQNVAGWQRLTIETGRKSGTSHADVWPDGEGWEIDTDRGRVNTPDAGWDRFSHHEELYFRRRTTVVPAAPAKQGKAE